MPPVTRLMLSVSSAYVWIADGDCASSFVHGVTATNFNCYTMIRENIFSSRWPLDKGDAVIADVVFQAGVARLGRVLYAVEVEVTQG
jgi:hypothetical protein